MSEQSVLFVVDLLCNSWGRENLRQENVSVRKYCWVMEIILEAHLNALVKNWISSECPFNLRLLITPGAGICHYVECDLSVLLLAPTGEKTSLSINCK